MHTLIFLCVENSCRSQIAQAFAIKYGKDKVNALSAGSNPSYKINENAILLMKEFDYDLNTHRSSGTSELAEMEVHTVVSMGCGIIVQISRPKTELNGTYLIQRTCN